VRLLTRLLGVRPGWARRVGYLELTRNQTRRLEAIRQRVGVSDEVFLLQLASDPEGTKRLQRFIYGWLKRKTPEMPERLLLARLVRNRFTAARLGGGDLFGLASVPPEEVEVRIRRIAREYRTIDLMADAITADQRAFGGPLSVSARSDFSEAAKHITDILAESGSSRSHGQ
jgi:hypothetical protein